MFLKGRKNMELYFYEDRFAMEIEHYKLTDEQLRYTGHPKECIHLSKVDPDRYSILAIVEGKLVTFFVLHKNEGVKPYSNNNHSILLRAFSTDFRYQGNGYAKKALMLLPQFVRENFKEMNEIVLAVNIQNVKAQELYKKCGFIDNGVRKMGRKGELMIMSYYLY
jgi:RimJ/RimL family protein N-acetyltransferase